MASVLTPVRGMNDVLPEDTPAWERLERVARETLSEYGYRELRLPLLERTFQVMQIKAAIAVGVEAVLPVVPALDDMQRDPGKDQARSARHPRSTMLPMAPLTRKNVVCPCF